VSIPDDALPIDNYLSRHAPQFNKVDFLTIALQHTSFWVRQADKW
jgi:hypothetical protein